MCHRQKTNAHNICFCIQKVKCRIATLEELQLCHSEAYALLYGTMAENRAQLPASILGKKERERMMVWRVTYLTLSFRRLYTETFISK